MEITPPLGSEIPKVIRLYRAEFSSHTSRIGSHGTTKSWVVGMQFPSGATKSKCFSDLPYGGPVFSWMAACDLLVSMTAMWPTANVYRTPRPGQQLLDLQFSPIASSMAR